MRTSTIISLGLLTTIAVASMVALTATGSPKDRADAQIRLDEAAPLATAAAIRVTIVAPVEARLEADRAATLQAQTLKEQADKQELEHAQSMLVLSETHAITMNVIAANGAKAIGDIQATIVERQADSVASASTVVGLMAIGLALVAGVAGCIFIYLKTRAHVFYTQNGEMIIIHHNQIMLPERVAGPLIMIGQGPDGEPAIYPQLPDFTTQDYLQITSQSQGANMVRAIANNAKCSGAAQQISQMAMGTAQNLIGQRGTQPKAPRFEVIGDENQLTEKLLMLLEGDR